MASIRDLIEELKKEWSVPRTAIHNGEPIIAKLVCRLADGASEFELAQLRAPAPPALRDFWLQTREAELFVDVEYGQWGLRLWSPLKVWEQTKRLRSQTWRALGAGDLIVGEFLGDSDLLVVRNNPEAPDFGHVIVALPIDERPDWCTPATSFENFLNTYVAEQGDKFWSKR